jgi:DNA-binding Lrp family transcriptional regulator
MPDEIDNIILSQLGKNSRISSQDISKVLQNFDYSITDRAIRQRMRKLEKNNIILGYSTILNPELVSDKVNRTILLKFKFSKKTTNMINRLKDYSLDSQFCTFAGRLNGDFDWVCHFVFDSIEQYDLETNNFLNKFSELISDYRSYETNLIKSTPYMMNDEEEIRDKKLRIFEILNSIKKYDSLNDRLQAIVESLVKYFDARFARVWFYDKKKKALILKFSAGKYKNLKGEFSNVSIKSLKIGTIATSKKPVVSNDVVHDRRIKFPEWAKKEKLKSFAGYPILYKGQVAAVLAMFSTKKLSPADFELLGVFSDQLSRELTGFFEAKDFLLE